MSNLPNSDPVLHDAPMPRDRMLCAADYPAEGVEWLWPGRIPIGKVTLLVGDPGNGKSLVALDVAARVSCGAPWPDLPPSPLPLPPSPPGSVLILSIEDDLRDTIRPRLDAAGADPSRIYILPSIVDLRHDIEQLRTALAAAPDCRLIIIDSINAYVGPGDSHFHSIVRRVFRPLAELAAEKQLAVLAVSHLRKSEGAAIQRAAGSMGFVAAARAVWTVCRDRSQAGRYLLLPLKNNFVAETTGLAFRIEVPATQTCPAPAIAWQADSVTTSTEDALNQENKPRRDEDSELHLAAAWLTEELAGRPMPAMYIIAEGFMGGFNERTLRRALDWIGGVTKKESFDGGWIWAIPDRTSPPDARDPPENLSASQNPVRFGENTRKACPLRENPDESQGCDPFLRPNQVMSEVRPLRMNTAMNPKFAAKPRSA